MGDSMTTIIYAVDMHRAWAPTMNLRFVQYGPDMRAFDGPSNSKLQQLWQSDRGETEWRGVEVVRLMEGV